MPSEAKEVRRKRNGKITKALHRKKKRKMGMHNVHKGELGGKGKKREREKRKEKESEPTSKQSAGKSKGLKKGNKSGKSKGRATSGNHRRKEHFNRIPEATASHIAHLFNENEDYVSSWRKEVFIEYYFVDPNVKYVTQVSSAKVMLNRASPLANISNIESLPLPFPTVHSSAQEVSVSE